MLSFINEKRKAILRKKIFEELKKIKPKKILDNGSGKKGSWDYPKTSFAKITQSDIMSGDNAEHLKFKDKSFDCVVFAGVVQYLDHPEKALKECHRVLAKNGTLIVSTINAKSLINALSGFKSEKIVFTMDRFKDMLESAGFKVLKEEFIDFPFIPKSRKMILYFICRKKS